MDISYSINFNNGSSTQKQVQKTSGSKPNMENVKVSARGGYNPIEKHAMWLLGEMEVRQPNARVGPDLDEVAVDEGGPHTVIHIKGSDSAAEWIDNVAAIAGQGDSVKAAALEIYKFLTGSFKKNIVVLGYSRGALIAQCLASMLGRDCRLLVLCATPGYSADLIHDTENLRMVPKVIIDRDDCAIRNLVRPMVGGLENFSNVIGNVQYDGDDWDGFQAHTNLIDVTCPELGVRDDGSVPHRNLGSRLLPGETMYPGDMLKSGDYELRQQSGDGNLVLYYKNDHKWASMISGNGNHCFRNQWDGHLVAYNQTGGSASISHNSGPGIIVLQADGNLVQYAKNGQAIWATGTQHENRSGAYGSGYKL